MEPMDYTFKAGTRLALYVYSADYNCTWVPMYPPAFTLYSGANTYIDLPIVPTYSIFYDANYTGDATGLYDALGGYSDTYPIAGQSAKTWNQGYRVPVTTVGSASIVKLNTRRNEFLGWNTKANGTGTVYQPGDSIPDNAMAALALDNIITLYAQWTVFCECELCEICGGCMLDSCCQGVDCDCTPCPHGRPVTSIRINAGAIETVARGNAYKYGVILNEGAKDTFIVWTVSDSSFALIDDQANVYILNKTGTVRLIATDPISGLSYSVTLRIAS